MTHPLLLDYQKYLLRIINAERALVVEKYGRGKSVVAMMKCIEILQPHQSAIILCRSRNINTWCTEFSKFLELTPQVIQTGKELRSTEMLQQFVLISHGLAQGHVDAFERLFYLYNIPIIVLDESTCIKSMRSHRTAALLEIAKLHANACSRKQIPDSGIRLALTGNPVPEGVHELWPQIQWTRPYDNPLGSSYYRFLGNYFITGEYAPTLRHDALKPLLEEARKCIATTPAPAPAAPPGVPERSPTNAFGIQVTYRAVEFEPTAEQHSLINSLLELWELPLDASYREQYIHKLTVLLKTEQILNGFALSESHDVFYLIGNPKVNCLVTILREESLEESPCIIWCHYEADYEVIGRELNTHRISFNDGRTAKGLQSFANGDTPVILMPVSSAAGYNELVRASRAIFYTNLFSREARDQAEGRLVRKGQKASQVTFIDICSASYRDRDIVNALQAKRFSSATILNLNTLRRLPNATQARNQGAGQQLRIPGF